MNRPVSATWLNVAAQTTPAGSSVVSSFTYDATNRRIGQTVDDDSWWNRPTAASSISYAANSLNQYTAVGSASPTYDGNGNLTYDGHFTYCYDTESRLTSVLSAGTCAAPTTTVASYAYDGQGRRKSKTVGATTTVYVTDADNREVLEYDGTSGALQNWYAFGLGPDEALNQMNVASNPNTRQTLIPDVIGSIVGPLDSGGTLTKFGYQTFGENPSLTSGGYRYTGRRLDPETLASSSQPSGLYYYRARTYSPTWGRFLQPDPSGYSAGPSLYAYTNNDPLNLTDPQGFAADAARTGFNTAFSGNEVTLDATLGNLANGDVAQRLGAGTGLVAGFASRTLAEAGAYVVGGAAVGRVLGMGAAAVSSAAETAAPKVFADGSFSITDFSGYPEGLPKPDGPFRLLEGSEYDAARSAANQANRAMHAADPTLDGLTASRDSACEIRRQPDRSAE
jgi:RHS repeat-associated protein